MHTERHRGREAEVFSIQERQHIDFYLPDSDITMKFNHLK